MRIVSGRFRGRKFGLAVSEGVRPTQDAVRESVFNVLGNQIDLEGVLVADIFAGTGSFGFEALSRDCGKVVFFEKSRKVAENIRKTANEFGLNENEFEIITGNAEVGLKLFHEFNPDKRFGLVFSDPPYNLLFGNSIMNLLQKQELLSSGAILVIESSAFEILNPTPEFTVLSTKIYGDTKVNYMIYNDPNTEQTDEAYEKEKD